MSQNHAHPEKAASQQTPAAAKPQATLQEAPEQEVASTLPPIQCSLTVGAPDDPLEDEADQMADHVMRMPEPGFIQRKCAACEDEEHVQRMPISRFIQRAGGTGGAQVSTDTASRISSSRGGGAALPDTTRSFMESRFGHSFNDVRIHDGGEAATLSRNLSAQAFTVGNDVFFNSGKFAPETADGKRLLAHELTHVVQQSSGRQAVQRVPAPGELVQFDAQATQIRAHAAYLALPAASRRLVEEILRIAHTRDNASYFSDKMLLLLNTPDAPAQAPAPPAPGGAAPPVQPPSVEESMRAETERSMYDERSRQFQTEGQLAQDEEERASADPARHWTHPRGQGGIRYDLDASDPSNIVVRARVYLHVRNRTRPRGMSQADFDKLRQRDRDDVAMVRELEDGIEKAASAMGYTVDLDFLTAPAANAFTVDVDMSRWTDAGNFVGEAHGLAHELHHLLSLDDRYNYIESHATNDQMTMPNRIYWFRQEMNHIRTAHDADSIMADSHGGSVLTDDIAAVSGLPEATIIAARQRINDLIAQRRQQARARVISAYLRVNSVHPTLADSERSDALRIGRNVLKNTLTPDELEGVGDYLGRMISVLTGGEIKLGPEIAACRQWVGYVLNGRVPIHLCRSWLNTSEEEQIRTLIHESAHAVGIGEPGGETYEAIFDCSPRGADLQNSADAWGHFVHCITGQLQDSAALPTGQTP